MSLPVYIDLKGDPRHGNWEHIEQARFAQFKIPENITEAQSSIGIR